MNALLRKIIINHIAKAKSDAIAATEIRHPGLTGRLREIILNTLITPLLNSKYGIGTGKVIDFKGDLSKEIDLCIYSKHLLPAFFFYEKDAIGTFPIESVLKCIEVKSVLDLSSLRSAYENFKYLEDNLVMSPGFYDEYGRPLAHYVVKHKYDLFAFDFGAKKYSDRTLLDLYKKVDPNWSTDPLISSICVLGKGWLMNSTRGWMHQPFDNNAGIHEEVISYLSTLTMDLPNTEEGRGTPRLGIYLNDISNMKKLF